MKTLLVISAGGRYKALGYYERTNTLKQFNQT